jgi:nitroreductase
MNFIQQLQWRYATKQFDKDKKIDPELWQQIESSLILTPSSFGLQPWKFIVITDPDLKQQLLPLSWHQKQVVDCSHFVVLCAKDAMEKHDVDAFLDNTIRTRGGTRNDLKAYEEMMLGFLSRMNETDTFHWAKNQVYIALGQLMATAAALEVDACPMEGINPPAFDQLLELSGYKTVVACALGYRHQDDKYATLPKVRFSPNVVIEHK